jgi:alpha-glucosidase
MPTSLEASIGHIPVHIRGGAVLLLHSSPEYTTAETRAKPYELLVSLDSDGSAVGSAYVDDGESNPDAEGMLSHRALSFKAQENSLRISGTGSFVIKQQIERITVLGVSDRQTRATINHSNVGKTSYDPELQRLNLTGLSLNLNSDVVISWSV